MNISFGGIVLPPQVTGHPAALPAEAPKPAPGTAIAEVAAETASQNAAAEGEREAQTTPPSAMQRKIMEILERQAEEARDGAVEPSEDDPPRKPAYTPFA